MPKIKEITDDRPERLAINIADLTRLDEFVLRQLLGGKLDGSPTRTDKYRADEAAVMLTCDLLTAAIACDVIREHDREAGDPVTRVYLRRVEAWRRLPADAVLTVVEREGDRQSVVLNPDVFVEDVSVESMTSPADLDAVEF